MTDKIQAKVITGSLGMSFSDTIAAFLSSPGFTVFNSPRYVIFPGFCDVHVHFREPGFSYKETMETGSRASARGGYTTVCTMPNLNPVPDSLEHLNAQLERIRSGACIQVVPYGAITVGERGETLADLEAMAPYAAGFSDDGRGVQSEELMRQAMLRAKALGKPIVAHCEDNSLLRGGLSRSDQRVQFAAWELPALCRDADQEPSHRPCPQRAASSSCAVAGCPHR